MGGHVVRGPVRCSIRRLIAGAQEVSRGNLNIALPEKRGRERSAALVRNLQSYDARTEGPAEPCRTNAELTERQNFMEAVLSGVSAGVIGLDSNDRITLLSRSAEKLLEVTSASAVGQALTDIVRVAPVL